MIDAAASAIEERRECVKSAELAGETSNWDLKRGIEEIFTTKRIRDGRIRGDESSTVASPYDRILHGIYKAEVSGIDINQRQIQVRAFGANIRSLYNGVPCDFI